METKHQTVEILWQRLEDAKHQLDLAHSRTIEPKQDKIAPPFPDGNYENVQALHAKELAVKNYLKALSDLKAALLADQEGDGESEPEASATPEGLNGITPREREVLVLIASGKSSKQIATHLGIAFRTVVCHRYRIQSKLKVHNTADLTRAAMRMGLIEL